MITHTSHIRNTSRALLRKRFAIKTTVLAPFALRFGLLILNDGFVVKRAELFHLHKEEGNENSPVHSALLIPLLLHNVLSCKIYKVLNYPPALSLFSRYAYVPGYLLIVDGQVF